MAHARPPSRYVPCFTYWTIVRKDLQMVILDVEQCETVSIAILDIILFKNNTWHGSCPEIGEVSSANLLVSSDLKISTGELVASHGSRDAINGHTTTRLLLLLAYFLFVAWFWFRRSSTVSLRYL